VLSGSVLSVWARIENVLAARTGHNTKMQVVRLKTAEGVKIVGEYFCFFAIRSLREKNPPVLFFGFRYAGGLRNNVCAHKIFIITARFC